MSDFSYTAKCPFCGGRFAPDDGYCACPGSLAWQEEQDEKEREDDERTDSQESSDRLINGSDDLDGSQCGAYGQAPGAGRGSHATADCLTSNAAACSPAKKDLGQNDRGGNEIS